MARTTPRPPSYLRLKRKDGKRTTPLHRGNRPGTNRVKHPQLKPGNGKMIAL